MTIIPDEIRLDESHTFHVKVRDGERHFAGELSLSPEKITLKVMGEESEERKCGIRWGDIGTLSCANLNSSFLLIGLKCTSGMGSLIEHLPKQRSYFETHFEVDKVIYFPRGMAYQPQFIGFQFQFKALPAWLGNTINQEKIIQEYKSGSRIFDKLGLLDEFDIPLYNEGNLGVHYSTSVYYSSPEFRAGIIFPPLLFMAFHKPKNALETTKIFYELRTLFEFLIGDELEIEHIEFHSNIGFQTKASFYYPFAKHTGPQHDNAIFFPLGRNLRWDTLSMPEFPLECFDTYFKLPKKDRGYFDKYVRYRRLQNVEERFLGYFRILENLCYKAGSYLDNDLLAKLAKRSTPFLYKYFQDKKAVDAFLCRLIQINNSKYNTEKCIGDFLKAIPPHLSSKWTYQKKDIDRVCKLRNDISHANDYDVGEAEIEKMAKFCEVLLVVSLMLKLHVEMDAAIAVIDRLDGYSMLKSINKQD